MKDRIVKIMESEKLTPGQFAERVGIQRSAVSHLVTGRNKPSLEVVQKILNTFRLIQSDWFILGVGTMYRGERQSQQPSLFAEESSKPDVKGVSVVRPPEKTLPEKSPNYEKTAQAERNEAFPTVSAPLESPKAVKNIILYYSDGTFEEFSSSRL